MAAINSEGQAGLELTCRMINKRRDLATTYQGPSHEGLSRREEALRSPASKPRNVHLPSCPERPH